MSLTAAELRAVYTVDEGPLNKSLGGLEGKVGSTLGKVATAAAGLFAFDKLKDGFFDVTGAASDLNETVNKSNTIFGSNAAAIDQWSKSSAQNLGLSREQALAAAAGFGDMFGQIGFAGDQAADMSTKVVQMAADLGSFNNLPTADVADRMSAAFRGEYDSLQALIPNINAARVEQEAMAATGKKNADELTAQEKAAAVLAIVNKDGARAMGDFAKTSDGAANAAKIASAEWENQKAAIGQRLLPILTTMIGFLRTSVIPAVGTMASFIADDVVPALKDMAEWVEANQGPVKVIAGLIGGFLVAALAVWAARSVASAATNTVAWFTTAAASSTSAATQSKSAAQVVAGWLLMGTQALLHGLKVAAVWTAQIVASAVTGAASFAVQVARVVGGWVLMGAQAMLQAARMAAAWFIALGPVGWVIAAVIGLVALIIANWDTVVSWTKTAWDAVVNAVKWAIDFVVMLFMNFTGVGLIIQHWDTIKNATSAAWGAITGAISAAWNWITGIIGGAVGAVRNAVSGAWNWVRDSTSSAWNSVVGFVSGAWGRITGAISGGINDAVSFVAGLPGRILGAIGNMGSLLYNKGRDLIQGLLNGAGSLLSRIGSFFLDKVPGWIKGPFKAALGINSPSTVFAGYGENIGEGLVGGLAAMRPAVAREMLRMADHQAMATIGVRAPGGVMAGPSMGRSVAAADGSSGGIGELVHIENYNEAPGSSPHSTAQALAIEARTRGWGGR